MTMKKLFTLTLILFSFHSFSQYEDKKKGVEFMNRAQHKLQNKDTIGAIYDYTNAIDSFNDKNDKDLILVYHWRGSLKAGLKDYRGSIQDFSKAIEIAPNFVFSYIRLAEIQIELKDYSGAISNLTKLFDNYQGTEFMDKYKAYVLRAQAKFLNADYRGSILDVNICIENTPKEGFLYYFRGTSEIYIGNKELGCIDLSKAGELGYSKAYKTIKEFCN